ncbi:beta-glucanase (GH16 family) [Marmoricola sp. OAE513]|uniref:family 16 glycosylhydrolase n=1 Tax=Marmoricola sp. OAE513 TaxID=2817894 RepID=UPI001AEAC492
MFRIPALATAGTALIVVAALGGSSSAGFVLAAEPTTPNVLVTSAPGELVLEESGTVTVQVTGDAHPGDRIILNTAGSYNTGFVRVSETVLDDHLMATLKVPGREYLGSYDYWASTPATSVNPERSSERFTIDIVSPPPPVNPNCGSGAPRKADGSPWVCTFADDFEGKALDRRYWVAQRTENSGFTTGNKIKYACAFDSPETIGVRGGNLELSLVERTESRDCGKDKSSKYAYGQVMHHQTFAQTYGRYEVRAKIPDLRVPGSQQSFWLWPEKDTYGPWPLSGEIDFAEMYSNDPGIVKPFIHYTPGESTDGTNKNVTHTRCPIKVGQFNTYGLVWEPGKLTILLNGKVCMINEYSSALAGFYGETSPFDHPFYLALNQAMGAIGNEYVDDQVPDRLTTQIDYVRIWK